MKIFLVFVFLMASVAHATGIVGVIDAVSLQSNGNARIHGWACDRGVNSSIQVHLYLNGRAGIGQGYGAYSANRNSEAAVSQACQTSGVAHRFEIIMPAADVVRHQGKSIYVHGISAQHPNLTLNRSGTLHIPTPSQAPVVQRFGWEPATVTVGQQQTFFWDVRHVQHCYTTTAGAQPEQRPTSGSVGPLNRPSPGAGESRWYCTDLQGNRFPAAANEFLSSTWTVVMGTPARPTASVSGTNITVNWPAVTGTSNYRIQQRVNGGSWSASTNTGTSRSRTVSGVAGSSYQFQVKACHSNGQCSGWSLVSTSVTVSPAAPAIPTGLTARLNGTTINTSWNAVSGAASYRIRQRINGTWGSAISTGTSRTRNFPAAVGSSYQYQVRACNAGGQCSDWSAVVSINISSGVVYLHTDILGSVIAESDEAGAIIKINEYKPYGKRKEL